MSTFEEVLSRSTAPGANIIPGCVLSAVDKTGKFIYSGSSGYHSILPGSPPIDPNGTFWIASCSKLVGTIAALQCVERGLISLDDPVSRVLPELSDPQIIVVPGRAELARNELRFTKATKQITLRQLITHTSGLGYDFLDPFLITWRSSRGEQPKTFNGTVVDAQSVPLKFEPGEGWIYGGGIDWAGLLVARLNHNMPLEEYLKENVFKPLGLMSTSFRLECHPEIQDRLVSTSERQVDGTLKPSQILWTDYAPDDCAGAGLYSTANDFTKIIGDLVKETPTLLQKATVEQMFKGQLAKESNALKDLAEVDVFLPITGLDNTRGKINCAFGGLVVEEDTPIMKKGTLFWAGTPNLYWFANRDEGIAGFYGSQVLPPWDQASQTLAKEYFQELFRLNSAKHNEPQAPEGCSGPRGN